MTAWIGVDVGGTSVKLGAVTPDGERLGERRFDIEPGWTARDVFERMAREVAALATAPPHAIGIGLPGLLNRERGRVENSPNLPWLTDVDVRGLASAACGIPAAGIRLENDANVAALGEIWLGGAAGARNALVVTLGTGIGGGLILDGRLFLGEGLAGEIGHVTVAPDGPPCGCGSHGCLETLASASAATRRARELGLPAESPGNLERLAANARAADGPERALLTSIGRDLGHGLGNVVCLLDVRTFVFGGGFAAALDTLESGIRSGLAEWAYGNRVAAVRLERATLGASAGWIGAARLLAP